MATTYKLGTQDVAKFYLGEAEVPIYAGGDQPVPPAQDIPVEMIGDHKIKIYLDRDLDNEGNRISDFYAGLTQDVCLDPYGDDNYPGSYTDYYSYDEGDSYMMDTYPVGQISVGIMLMGQDFYDLDSACTKVEVNAVGSTTYLLGWSLWDGYYQKTTIGSTFIDLFDYADGSGWYITHNNRGTRGRYEIGDKITFRYYLDPTKIFQEGYSTYIYLRKTTGSRYYLSNVGSIHYKDGTVYTPTADEEFTLTPAILETIDFIQVEHENTYAASSDVYDADPTPVPVGQKLDGTEAWIQMAYDSYNTNCIQFTNDDGRGYRPLMPEYIHIGRDPETNYWVITGFSANPNGGNQ